MTHVGLDHILIMLMRRGKGSWTCCLAGTGPSRNVSSYSPSLPSFSSETSNMERSLSRLWSGGTNVQYNPAATLVQGSSAAVLLPPRIPPTRAVTGVTVAKVRKQSRRSASSASDDGARGHETVQAKHLNQLLGRILAEL